MLNNMDIPHPLHPARDDNDDEPPRQLQQRVYRPRINFNPTSDFVFNERFRVRRTVFEEILGEIGEELEPDTNRSQSLSARQQILLTLHWLGNGAQLHVTADAHGVGKSTMERTRRKVIETINRRLFPTKVKFPNDMGEIVEKFHNIAGKPCCCWLL
uniref:Nuclease HARBI1 n=1 Tax=Cacopsylla melanoneura TaxID=428564 RepID=A0A8D8QP82_9HEMI